MLLLLLHHCHVFQGTVSGDTGGHGESVLRCVTVAPPHGRGSVTTPRQQREVNHVPGRTLPPPRVTTGHVHVSMPCSITL